MQIHYYSFHRKMNRKDKYYSLIEMICVILRKY